MKKGLASKVLVIQAAVLLVSAPIVTASPHIIYAASEPVQKVIGTLGTISVEKVTQDENGHLNWELSITKEASTSTRQLAIEFEDKQTLDFKVSEANSTDQEIIPDEAGRYLLGMANQSNEMVNINVQTETVPDQVDYQLKIATYVLEDEQRLALTNPLVQTFSYQLEETDTSTSNTLTTSTSEMGDGESVNSSEEISSEESEVSVDSSTSDSESITETTTSTEDETIVDTITTTESSSSETESSEETTVSSSQTESTEETTSSEAETATSEFEGPVQEIQRSIRGSGLGTGNPIVPRGAIKLDEMFDKKVWDREKDVEITDYTGIIAPGSADQNNGMPYDEITLSGSQRAIGVWSKEKYRLDFTKDFHGRTYVNFGPEDLNGDRKIDMHDAADGFAFVMHNDPNKDKAITSANKSTDGQNLGVYGGTRSWGKEDSKRPHVFAIKNSVAVEFDLFGNTDTDESDGINYDGQSADTKIIPHMAYAYPGDLANGYISMGGSSWWNPGGLFGIGAHGYTAMIKHRGLTTLDGVRNNTWYEFRYDFDKASQTFSYYLKNPMPDGEQTNVTTIPYADLEAQLKLSANEGKAYWGFTGANGAAAGQTKFVFTQVPVDMDAEVLNDVVSEELTIVDKDNAENYTPEMPAAVYGNEVTLKSDFVLQSDSEAGYNIDTWSSWIDPELYDITQGVSNVKAVLNGKEFVGTGTVGPKGTVTVTFKDISVPKPLTAEAQKLHMSYTAKLKSDGEITKTGFESQVSGREIGNNTPTSFQGKEVSYWVIPTPQSPTVLSWDYPNPNLNTDLREITKDRSEVVAGYNDRFYWQDLDDGDQLVFYLKNGNETVYTSSTTTKGKKDFVEQPFTIPSKFIAYGENNFKVQVFRLDNGKEVPEVATLDLKLTVTGTLSFETFPEKLSWTGRKVIDSKGVLSRDTNNEMELSVLDSRDTDENWKIFVHAELQEAAQVPFDFVFKNSGESSPETITSSPLLIMQKSDVESNDFNFTKIWDETSGILLDSKEYMHVGKDEYSGKVDMVWTLSNTAKIQ